MIERDPSRDISGPDKESETPIRIFISEDRMQARLALRPPREGEGPITREQYDRGIQGAGLVHGLLKDRVELAWERYSTTGSLPAEVTIARGTPFREASSGRVEYDLKLENCVAKLDHQDEDLDIVKMRLAVNVDNGAALGRWFPAQEGITGVGVDGTEFLPEQVVEGSELSLGEGIRQEPAEGGSFLLVAELSGILIHDSDGTPSVRDSLDFEGDVDLSTGSLNVNGHVHIHGCVRPGLRVDASGDIQVEGVVDRASLQAGGNITLEAGLIGEEGCRAHSQGDMHLRFAQNAHLVCGSSVVITGSDTASRIECVGELRALEGKGRLQGGVYHVGSSVRALELGSDLGAPTKVNAGQDPFVAKEIKRVRLALKEISAQERKQRRGIPSARARTKVKTAMELTRRRQFLNGRLGRLQDKLSPNESVVIIAQAKAYYGLTVSIGRETLRHEETTRGRSFEIDPETGKIVAHPI
jgi:uncharacterized protein